MNKKMQLNKQSKNIFNTIISFLDDQSLLNLHKTVKKNKKK